jgi:CheY-like chemotaxis protein
MFAFDSLFDMPILRFAPLHWKNVASGLIRRIGAMCHHHRLAADREASAAVSLAHPVQRHEVLISSLQRSTPLETTRASILVVDDDPAICELIAAVLVDEGYDVATVPDGPSALAHIAVSLPHVIILDYAMPTMSGGDVLAHLSRQELQHVPVIVVSASIYAERAHAEGASYVIAKPFALPSLLQAIRACVTTERPLPDTRVPDQLHAAL